MLDVFILFPPFFGVDGECCPDNVLDFHQDGKFTTPNFKCELIFMFPFLLLSEQTVPLTQRNHTRTVILRQKSPVSRVLVFFKRSSEFGYFLDYYFAWFSCFNVALMCIEQDVSLELQPQDAENDKEDAEQGI